MKKKLFVIGLFALMLLLPSNKVLAIGYGVEVDGEDLTIEPNQNSDGTAKWDASSNTLELNNYNGASINIDTVDNIKIVLKGTNIIDADGNDGIYSCVDTSISGDGTLKIVNSSFGIDIEEADLTIDSGLIEIVEPEYDGVYAYSETEKGNITINSDLTIKDGMTEGIFASNVLTLDEGTINVSVGADELGLVFGLDAAKIIVNKAKVYVKSDFIGIAAGDLLEINGGYVESEAGSGKDAGVAVLAFDTGSTKIVIGDNVEMIPNDISQQKVTVDFFGEMNLIVYGKDGIEVDLTSETPLLKNVANKVIFQEKKVEPEKTEEANPNTYDNIYYILLMLGISLGGLATIYRKKVNN